MKTFDHDLERTARRRVAARLGWTLHALVFLAVNAGLAWLSWRSGRGWGLGLLVHGLVVWVKLGGGGLHERWLTQERERLQQQRRA